VGLTSRVMDAPPVGLGQLRQRGRLEGMNPAVAGVPVHDPVLSRTAALDLEAGGAVRISEAQPAEEQHRGEAVPLRADHGELTRELRVEVVVIRGKSIHGESLCSHQGRRPTGEGRRSGSPQVNAIMTSRVVKKQ
jgi:hypothetical protein